MSSIEPPQSNNGDQTLQTYESTFTRYISETDPEPNGSIKAWIGRILSYLPKSARILEIGSASGRDADYIETLGYEVERSDAAKAFVDYMCSHGQKARLLNVLTDEISNNYDLIFANMVLLHFTKSQTKAVCTKIFDSLSSGGVFAFSIKQGTDAFWSDQKVGSPRFFQFWEPEDVQELMASTGFEILHSDSYIKRKAPRLMIIARKRQPPHQTPAPRS